MKNFFKEYFYIPKHGKIRDKVMVVRVVLTVGIMLFCLAAMSISAYAYFSSDVSSGVNVLRAAKFEAEVLVENGPSQPSVTKNKNVLTYTFAPGEYKITLKKKDSSTAKTGFYVIRIGDQIYHTQQIGADLSAEGQSRESVSFLLNVKAEGKLEIEAQWGTSSYYSSSQGTENPNYIENSDPLRVLTVEAPVAENQNIQNETQPSQSSETDPLANSESVTDTGTDSQETSTDFSDPNVTDGENPPQTEALQP